MEIGKALSVVAIFGGVGAIMDFWIGREGQKRVRNRIEDWWLRMSYINLRSFGREESLFAVEVIDRLFGRKFFSERRLVSVSIVVSVAIIASLGVRYLMALLTGAQIGSFFMDSSTAFRLAIGPIFFAVSLSATRFAAEKGARVLQWHPRLNLFILLSLITVQYIALCYWSAILSLFADPLALDYEFFGNHCCDEASNLSQLAEYLRDYPQDVVRGLRHSILIDNSFNLERLSPAYQARRIISIPIGDYGDNYMLQMNYGDMNEVLGIVANLGRLIILAVFGASFLFQPLLRRISTLWLRMIESDKPIFTLMLGGVGGVLGAGAKLAELFGYR